MASAYEDVANALLQRIQRGEFPNGAKLPTKTELAAEYHVGMRTLDAALLILKTRGAIYGVHGVGLYVGQPETEHGPTPGMFSAAGR